MAKKAADYPVALADFDCAMTCFSTMEREIQTGNQHTNKD